MTYFKCKKKGPVDNDKCYQCFLRMTYTTMKPASRVICKGDNVVKEPLTTPIPELAQPVVTSVLDL